MWPWISAHAEYRADFDARPSPPKTGSDSCMRPPKHGRANPAHVTAVALSRTGNPTTGDFGEATVICEFGNVLDDPSAL
jgi:hypothetical protein